MKKSFLAGMLIFLGSTAIAQKQTSGSEVKAATATRLTKQTAKQIQLSAVNESNVSEPIQAKETDVWKPIGDERKKSANGKKLKDALRKE